jgi:hypothetical protein
MEDSMAPHVRPDLQSHGPSNLLRFYCAALRSRLLRATPSDTSWWYRESEILKQTAQDLVETANLLEAQAHAGSQTHLPLCDGAVVEMSLDDEEFRKRFPYLKADDLSEHLKSGHL